MGELEHIDLLVPNTGIVLLFLITLGSYFVLYVVYQKTKNVKIQFTQHKLIWNEKRLDTFFLIFVCAQILFFFKTGVGKVGGESQSLVSFLFAILDIRALFPIYYLLRRKAKRKIFYINVLLYCAWQIAKGWSGFFLGIVFYELYFFLKDRKVSVGDILKFSVIPVFILLLGGKAYQYIAPLKESIRYNMPSYNEITYTEGLTKLTSRLTFFPISVGAYQNKETIARLYDQDLQLKELKGLLRPLLPSFMMKNKDFRNMNNLVIYAAYPDVNNKTGAGMGLFCHVYILLLADLGEAIVWACCFFIFAFFSKMLLDSLETFKGQFNLLYFMMLLTFAVTGSLEINFAYGIFPLFYLLPILFMFKVIKIQRK
jgi:hypothetical protein